MLGCSWGIPRKGMMAHYIVTAACMLLVGGLGSLSSCQMEHQAGKIVNLQGTVLISDNSLHLPTSFLVVGNRILVGDPTLQLVQMYETGDDAYRGTLDQQGRGPGEILSPTTVQAAADDTNAVWVYDLRLLRLTRFSVGTAHSERSVTLMEGLPYNPVWIDDSLIMSCGFTYEGGRFGHYDTTGRLLRTVGSIPEGRESAVPVPLHLQAYHSTVRKHPKKPVVAVATRYADRLDIFSVDGSILKSVAGPLGMTPYYTVASGGGAPVMTTSDDKTTFGFIDLAVTDGHIYALFSGRTRKRFPGKANYGQSVYVYDWDGNKVKEFRLDRDVFAIAVDVNDRVLYAIQHEPEVAVIAYKAL